MHPDFLLKSETISILPYIIRTPIVLHEPPMSPLPIGWLKHVSVR